MDSSRDIGKDGKIGSTNQYTAKDAFGYILGYYTGDYNDIAGLSSTAKFNPSLTSSGILAARYDLFNGNIGSMQTAIPDVTNYKNNVTIRPSTRGAAYKYDQLNRIKEARSYFNLNLSTNVWASAGSANDYLENFTYDAMGNISHVNRYGNSAVQMDNMDYRYQTVSSKTVTNRLYHVDDAISASAFTDDIDDQGTFSNTASTINSANNYSYDELGNLKKDTKEEIATITWTVYGKVKTVTRTGGSTKPDLEYIYDPMGDRICKITKPKPLNCNTYKYSYYLRDATGNEMAHYELTRNTGCTGVDKLYVTDHAIYGATRLGTDNKSRLLYTAGVSGAIDTTTFTYRGLGDKQYELANHLGNVLVTVTDKHVFKTNGGGSPQVDYFEPELKTISDYYAFGAPMPERQGTLACSTSSTTTTTTPINAPFTSNTSSFTAFTVSTTVSNAGATTLKASANNPNLPATQRTFTMVSGASYTITADLVGMTVSTPGNTYRVDCEVRLGAGAPVILAMTTIGTTYSTTFSSMGAGSASVRFTMIRTGPGPIPPTPTSVDFTIDNVILSQSVTTTTTTCVVNGKYRYGFNGKEKDNEIKGEENSYNYGMRMYDSRIGRPFSVDPYSSKYPHLSAYQFFSNNPILNIDLDGLEGVDYTKNSVLYNNGKPRFKLSDANNTAMIPIRTFMINGTMHILHGDKHIIYNPSSAPTALGLAMNTGWAYLFNIKEFSEELKNYTDNVMPKQLTDNTGVSDGVARGGFANTFRHHVWQSLIAMSLGENTAKRVGDYHERDGIVNVQNGEFRKDNVIDLLNNEYARDYAKGFKFNDVTKDVGSFTNYLNGLAQHIASTVDGYKDDKAFDKIRSGETKLFDANDKNVQKMYKAAVNLIKL